MNASSQQSLPAHDVSSVRYMSAKQLAERWATNTMAVYRQIESGRLSVLRLGRSVRIPIEEVERFEAKNTFTRERWVD
ncbi:excisionase family DNA-binding protein [Rhodococcus sp. SGAir0479]|uniref:excisionase family DNA-binding protein n=1 Tax=Rhodococcus sp. SGAir0479 TaxID=2567884 RepID=UPI0010CD3367|nr:excisionase family DNA-binding protein [Rhodococcus sp. SGAir0479]QCQ93046.1 helix-turn-helix domain-containing protein [Rhodococcus sp. SGAir0479]